MSPSSPPPKFEITEIKRGTITEPKSDAATIETEAFVPPDDVKVDFTTAQISEPIVVPMCETCKLPLAIGPLVDILGLGQCTCGRRK